MHRNGPLLIAVALLALTSLATGQTLTRPLPASRGLLLTTIHGKAVDSGNRALSNVTIRLRDARSGQILDSQTTDEAGLVTFHTTDPGTFVLELVDRDQTVLAASDILTVGAGETASTLVRLSSRRSPAGAQLNRAAVMTVIAAAAGAGIMARTVTGQPLSPTVVP